MDWLQHQVVLKGLFNILDPLPKTIKEVNIVLY
jgi:hypothetical protein